MRRFLLVMALILATALATGGALWAYSFPEGPPTLGSGQVRELSRVYSELPVPPQAKLQSISVSRDSFFYSYSSEVPFNDIERDFIHQMEASGWTARFREAGIYSFKKEGFYVALKPRGKSGFTVILAPYVD